MITHVGVCSLHNLFQQVFDIRTLCADETQADILGEGAVCNSQSSATRSVLWLRSTYMGPNLMTLYLSQMMSATDKCSESLGVYEPTERTPLTSPVLSFLDGGGGRGDADAVEAVVDVEVAIPKVLAMLVENLRDVAVVAESVEDVVVDATLLSPLDLVDEFGRDAEESEVPLEA